MVGQSKLCFAVGVAGTGIKSKAINGGGFGEFDIFGPIIEGLTVSIANLNLLAVAIWIFDIGLNKLTI